MSFYYTYSVQSSSEHSTHSLGLDANGLQDYISFRQHIPSSATVIRNQAELNRIPNDKEDIWISTFVVAGKKNLVLKQQQSMKNLTIGINALIGVSMMELSGLVALERVVIMRGGLSGGSGRLRVTNCANLSSIDIGEMAFMRYKNLELVDLPKLLTVKLDDSAFQGIQSVLMESSYGKRMNNQTCLFFNPFNLGITHFKETVPTDARR